MSAPNTNYSRNTAIRIDILSSDIRRIWFETPSEYAVPKTIIHNALLILYSRPKKACKMLEKAKALMYEEAELAYDYNKIRDVIIQSSDESIVELGDKYRTSIVDGNFSYSRKILNKLMRTSCLIDSSPGLEVQIIKEGGNNAVYTIRNLTNEDITISKMIFSAGAERLICDTPYPFIVHACESVSVNVTTNDTMSEINSHIEYIDKGVTKQLNPLITIECGSSEDY